MSSKIAGFFKRRKRVREKQITNENIIKEIESIKRLLRKQSIFQEAFRDEALKQIEEKNLNSIEPVLEFTDSLFYLGVSLKEVPNLSLKHDQAIEIVWQKLKSLFFFIDLEIICEAGVKFDPRLYEAIEKASQCSQDLTVTKVLQPGYIYKGKVVKPAKVIIGEGNNREGG